MSAWCARCAACSTPGVHEPHIDFGGLKESGFGREGGMASIAEMTEVKWVTFQMGKRELPF